MGTPKPTWHPWIPASHFAPGGLADGLMGAWFALEGAGPTAHDLSRNGNHGNLQGGVDWVAGRDGPVLDFPGNTGDYVSAPDNGAFAISDTITIVVRMATLDGTDTFITTKNEDGGWLFALNVAFAGGSPGAPDFLLDGLPGGWVNGSTDVADGLVHTLAGTYDGATKRVYVDGGQDGSEADSGSIETNTRDIQIGRRSEELGNYSDLDLHYLLIYNRALPAPDIRTLHTDPYALLRPVRRWWAVALDVGGLTHPVIGSGVVNSQVIIGGSP